MRTTEEIIAEIMNLQLKLKMVGYETKWIHDHISFNVTRDEYVQFIADVLDEHTGQYYLNALEYRGVPEPTKFNQIILHVVN